MPPSRDGNIFHLFGRNPQECLNHLRIKLPTRTLPQFPAIRVWRADDGSATSQRDVAEQAATVNSAKEAKATELDEELLGRRVRVLLLTGETVVATLTRCSKYLIGIQAQGQRLVIYKHAVASLQPE